VIKLIESFILFSLVILVSLYMQDFISALLAAITWALVFKNSRLQNRFNLLSEDFEQLKQKLASLQRTKKETSTEPAKEVSPNRNDSAVNLQANEVDKELSKISENHNILPIREPEVELNKATKLSEPPEPPPEKFWTTQAPQTNESLDSHSQPSFANTKVTQAPTLSLNKADLPSWLIWFNDTNITTKVGLLTLFFGFSFLLKYAADEGLLPIELRLIVVSLLGSGFVYYGIHLFQKADTEKTHFALLLQGGGIGVLYLTTYFAFKFYAVIPVELGILILLAIMASTIFLAVKQDAQPLAFVGIFGGFITPVIASSGQGNHIILFSYYLILNLTILGIAWFKSWRNLNLLGFVMTFWIAVLWGLERYQEEDYLSVQLFLLAFVAIYIAIPILFALKQPTNLKGLVDSSLVFGTPIIGFAIQSVLMEPFKNGLSISSLLFGIIYLTLAWRVIRRYGDDLKLLSQAYAALGLIFTTLSILFYFDKQIVSVIWAVEATGLIWLGSRQSRKFTTVFGVLILILAWLLFIEAKLWTQNYDLAFLNAFYMGAVVISLASFTSSFLIKMASEQSADKFFTDFATVSKFLLIAGSISWFSLHWVEFERVLPSDGMTIALLAHLLITAVILTLLEIRFAWKELSSFRFIWLAMLTLHALISFQDHSHPFANLGWLGWLLNAITFYYFVKWFEKNLPDNLINLTALHILSSLVFISVLALEAQRYAMLNYSTAIAESFVTLVVPILILQYLISKEKFWPFNEHADIYQNPISYVLISTIFLWLISFNLFFTGEAIGGLYLPIFNVIDMTALAGFLIIFDWINKNQNSSEWILQNSFQRFIGLAMFAYANAIILRVMYHWYGVEYNLQAWLASSSTQTTLAIFWSLLGVLVMQQAKARASRSMWIAGSILLALVVLKVFLIDLANSGSIARIISFIGVGAILLVVGYLFPMPKTNTDFENSKSQEEHVS